MTNPVRLQADRERLEAMAAAQHGRIVLLSAPARTSPRASVELRYVTAGSDRYPVERRESTRLSISLPDRYPFQPPVATVVGVGRTYCLLSWFVQRNRPHTLVFPAHQPCGR